MSSVQFKYTHNLVTNFVVDVPKNQKALGEYLKGEGVDCLLVTAQDAFLSEYNVLQNNQRFALSRFAGSTGDGIFVTDHFRDKIGAQANFILCVDGRYHLQAELETSRAEVELVKFPVSETLEQALTGWLQKNASSGATFGIDGQRVSYKRFLALQNLCKEKGMNLKLVDGVAIGRALPGWQMERPIEKLDAKWTGRSLASNLKRLQDHISKTTCLVTCASDDLAFLLNARGYHMPYASSCLGYSFSVGEEVVVFLPDGVHTCAVALPPHEKTAEGAYRLTIVRSDLNALKSVLAKLPVSEIAFNETAMNAFLPSFAQAIWPQAKLNPSCNAIELIRVVKTEAEKNAMRDAFLRSSRAIARTMRWVKEHTKSAAGANLPIHELDLSEKISQEYLNEGALDLSFRSIAGTAENGAVIHYGTPSPQRYLRRGDMTLLDSGAYYEAGLATDCTRVVFCGGSGVSPEKWQRDIYTTVVRSWLAGMSAEFEKATPCKDIDLMVRKVCQDKGFDYAHGTGHGVGIHVHESGIRMHPTSTYGFTEHAAVSMEPGIYLEGKGGVRIENVVFVKTSEKNSKHFCFENLIFVGLDWELIDVAQLDAHEKEWLRAYELKCSSLGTTVSPCPLLT